MAYLTVEDFAAGVDLRKSVVTAKAGTLRVLKNAFINAGGEIEERRRFARVSTQGAGVGANYHVGLVAHPNGQPAVFTRAASPAAPTPGFTTIALSVPGGPGYDDVYDYDIFGGSVFALLQRSDGLVEGWKDNTIVTGLPMQSQICKTHKTKMYLGLNNTLRFSAINDSLTWASGTGFGSIDLTSQDSGGPNIVAIEPYYQQLAILGQRHIQIWAMDPDPAKNQIVQVLGNIGAVARGASARYGNGDVLFLSNSGIRSLRARDASNAAVVNDIGSPIDALIVADLQAPILDGYIAKAKAVVDPLTGHFWLSIRNKIYVLAYYPATKVTAWSVFEPGFYVKNMVVVNDRIYLRGAASSASGAMPNDLYVYGGVSGAPLTDLDVGSGTANNYLDTTDIVAETPFLDASKPATRKEFRGIDIACEGKWEVWLNPDPLAPTQFVKVATVDNPTYSLAQIPYQATSTHIAIRLVSVTPIPAVTKASPRRVGALVIHYDEIDAQ